MKTSITAIVIVLAGVLAMGADARERATREKQNLAAYAEVAATLRSYLTADQSARATRRGETWLKHGRNVGSVDGKLIVNAPDAPAVWGQPDNLAPKWQSRIVSVDIAGSAAGARVELMDRAGFRSTAFFALSKRAEGWRIVGSVFDAQERSGGTAAEESEIESFRADGEAAALVQAYTDALRDGDAAGLRPHWFDHARIVGSIQGTPVDRDADGFCQLVAKIGHQPDFAARIVSLQRNGPAALTRIELINWEGVRYTDFLLLYRVNGIWRISEKVFDAHTHR